MSTWFAFLWLFYHSGAEGWVYLWFGGLLALEIGIGVLVKSWPK